MTASTSVSRSSRRGLIAPSDKPVLLLFANPDCGPCAALFPEVGRWQRDYAEKLTLAVISRGSRESNQSKVQAQESPWCCCNRTWKCRSPTRFPVPPAGCWCVPMAPSVARWLREPTPFADWSPGRLACRCCAPSRLRLLRLRERPWNSGEAKTTCPCHRRACSGLQPADLDGNVVHLSDLRGSSTLLVFWRPGCSFCQRMLPEIKNWERHPPAGAPQFLVVSSESVESNRALGLRSPVVLDASGMSIGSQFGATGTPMAVLVDAEGKIASALAAGAPAVLALARGGLDTATLA